MYTETHQYEIPIEQIVVGDAILFERNHIEHEGEIYEGVVDYITRKGHIKINDTWYKIESIKILEVIASPKEILDKIRRGEILPKQDIYVGKFDNETTLTTTGVDKSPVIS